MADVDDVVKADVSKLLKLIDGTSSPEEQLKIIQELTESRLAVMLKAEAVPVKFLYIVQEVTLKRFRRLGNEGMSSYSEAGESISFPDSDFAEYRDEIAQYLADMDKGLAHKAGVWFL